MLDLRILNKFSNILLDGKEIEVPIKIRYNYIQPTAPILWPLEKISIGGDEDAEIISIEAFINNEWIKLEFLTNKNLFIKAKENILEHERKKRSHYWD